MSAGIAVGDPHQRGAAFGALVVGGGLIDQHLGHIVLVVAGHHAADRGKLAPVLVGHGGSILPL
jgi:hypothetical protein